MNSPSSLPESTTAPPAPDGVVSVRLGELDGGVVAIGRRGGVTTLGGTTSVSWWIGAEDRWHRPATESSTRDRLVDGTPVLESLVRIPSGDAVGRTAVARVEGLDRATVVIDVENSSPIPVAFAYIVESDDAVSFDGAGIVVAGVGRLTLTRPAMGFAAAPSADDLLAVLESGDMAAEAPAWDRPGALAVLVPLPHTAHAVATFTPDADASTAASNSKVAALSDRDRIPDPDRIVAGWAAHAAGGPRLDLPDERHRAALAAATCDLLLGPDGGDTSSTGDPVELGLIVEALGRLGRTDDPAALNDLIERQRTNGSVAGDDPVMATLQLLNAVAAWWAGGAPADYVELTLGHLASAARWLGKRKQREVVAGVAVEVAAALRRAAGVLRDLDQPEVASAIDDHAEALVPAGRHTGSERITSASMNATLGAGLAWGRVATASAHDMPDVAASARFVIATLDEAVRTDGDTLVLLSGWEPSAAGAPVEAHDVPTRWGRLSYGVRWHGSRPALLWELEPWPGRSPAGEPSLTAPAIDPGWRASGPVGEALLGEPVGAIAATTPIDTVVVHPQLDPPSRPAPTPTASEPPVAEGGSFS